MNGEEEACMAKRKHAWRRGSMHGEEEACSSYKAAANPHKWNEPADDQHDQHENSHTCA